MSDLIDRQAAIDEIARWIGYIDEDMILRIQTGLKKVPSAQRTGRWIDDELICKARCSVCGEEFSWMDNDMDRFWFCPNCGARMEASRDAG